MPSTPRRSRAVPESAAGTALLRGAAAAVALAVLGLTWTRLFDGLYLDDEAGTLVVPWRWALGDRPFVDEENLAQIPSILVYPFVKAFAIARGYDVTGLVVFSRHLTLLLTLLAAIVVFLVVRRLVRWELALLVAALGVAFTFRGTEQVGSTTMAATLLMLGAVLGLRSVIDPPARRWALASGVAFGLAVAAYPTFLFVVPFYAVFLAFALGNRAVAMISSGMARLPDPPGPPTGRAAWLVVSAWALGIGATLGLISLILVSFGPQNLSRCWQYTLSMGREMGQLGGAGKAYEVASGLWDFVWSHPSLIVAALILLIVHRRWPSLGRLLLIMLPLALWYVAQSPATGTPGFVLLYAAIAPYMFVFVPRERRADGARLLAWIWTPSLLAGLMAAYTSSLGLVHASVGLFPATICTGVFLAWALEAVRPFGARTPWLACAALVGVLAVAVSLQYQQTAELRTQATARFSAGPWWGIRVTQAQHDGLTQIASDLEELKLPEDRLLVIYGGSALYLLWDGDLAANSYWIRPRKEGEFGPLPASTASYFRRQREVPTLVVHLVGTDGLTTRDLQRGCGGLDYPVERVRPDYAIHRKSPEDTLQDVLERLPR